MKSTEVVGEVVGGGAASDYLVSYLTHFCNALRCNTAIITILPGTESHKSAPWMQSNSRPSFKWGRLHTDELSDLSNVLGEDDVQELLGYDY